VPIVRLSTSRIRALGWTCKRKTREALKTSILAMMAEVRSEAGSSEKGGRR
jgi:hypothetical protein